MAALFTILVGWRLIKKKAAANPQALRAAELDWHQKNVVAPTAKNLASIGLPPQAAADPRVQAYFADRAVQQGAYSTIHHSDRIQQAWQASGGDPVRFLQNMTQSDLAPGHWQNDFQHAIRSGVYSERGNTARVTGRLEGALGIPLQPPQQAAMPGQPPAQAGMPGPQAAPVSQSASLPQGFGFSAPGGVPGGQAPMAMGGGAAPPQMPGGAVPPHPGQQPQQTYQLGGQTYFRGPDGQWYQQ